MAGQDLPQHVASVPIRLMFNAKHTRFHSPRTFAKPRRLYRRNPSTSSWAFDAAIRLVAVPRIGLLTAEE